MGPPCTGWVGSKALWVHPVLSELEVRHYRSTLYWESFYPDCDGCEIIKIASYCYWFDSVWVQYEGLFNVYYAMEFPSPVDQFNVMFLPETYTGRSCDGERDTRLQSSNFTKEFSHNFTKLAMLSFLCCFVVKDKLIWAKSLLPTVALNQHQHLNGSLSRKHFNPIWSTLN